MPTSEEVLSTDHSKRDNRFFFMGFLGIMTVLAIGSSFLILKGRQEIRMVYTSAAQRVEMYSSQMQVVLGENTFSQKPLPCGRYGDINDDGYISVDDMLLLRESAAGLKPLRYNIYFDVDKNGQLNEVDAYFIERYLSNMQLPDQFQTSPPLVSPTLPICVLVTIPTSFQSK